MSSRSCVDLGILLLIWRFCRRTGGGLGAVWAWVAGPILLGPLLIARYDLMVAIFAVAALTASLDPAVRGAFIGIGFSIKVWPIALLAGLRRWRELLTGGASALAATVVACGATALIMPNALDFLTAQQERGLQVESMAATPFVLLRALGLWDGFSTYQHGAMELAGSRSRPPPSSPSWPPRSRPVLLVVWWLRAHPTEATFYDAALTTVLFLVPTSRVLSPPVHDLAHRPGRRGVLGAGVEPKPVAWMLLAATLLTGITYPWLEEHYSWKGDCRDPGPGRPRRVVAGGGGGVVQTPVDEHTPPPGSGLRRAGTGGRTHFLIRGIRRLYPQAVD